MTRPRASGDAPTGGQDDLSSGMAVYANQLEIGYNAFEFLFEFGQEFEDGGRGGRRTRIVMAPAYAKVLMRVLRRSLDDYELSFGTIQEPAPCKADPD